MPPCFGQMPLTVTVKFYGEAIEEKFGSQISCSQCHPDQPQKPIEIMMLIFTGKCMIFCNESFYVSQAVLPG